MKWNQLSVITSSEAVEAVSSILMEAGANGVAIEDAMDLVNFESDPFGEILDKETFSHRKEGAEVIAYFPETLFLPEIIPSIQPKVEELASFGLDIGEYSITASEVEESDWATAWKKYYHPVNISRYLTIVPEWQEYTPNNPDEHIIYLDPGMAFGTGTHPTTRLTLQALEVTLRGGEMVLDVGTGSGVLSIASKFLGAEDVFAYDLDEVAVNSAKENMALNPIAKDVHVSANDLLNGVDKKADVIVANILADIIVLMLKDAHRCLKDDGTLIISGIIEDKVPMILEELEKEKFIVDQLFKQKDWYAIIVKKQLED
ncbi:MULTISPECIES: 50S ribosomal protein L11 methyltransferase [Enterococcaceae]|uniref:50S ribosomal protein L11 methyltransferase n=1 Tax=Enterococcaceae TaxID=81852 RepID=UPI000E4D6534|nr:MULTISPECIES: 50S ribosomal protein L11 methyltransferase [Enterococcaceae]MCI0130880.1 50S ribosomal protein L11 methyltransferase [Vagococcus sp. CY53-2]RGI30261.1 50S ribosomal protein L11 methyltransferase [Melissococcus sp. OM08-11BH]UNM89261.1 50S ribosomal protein L11 methyltransferase [Vagococcus sp. CY52-2]